MLSDSSLSLSCIFHSQHLSPIVSIALVNAHMIRYIFGMKLVDAEGLAQQLPRYVTKNINS
jgi:hypothetical protein